MTAQPCKVIVQVAFKAGGDVFYHLLANRPYHLANISPGKIQCYDLHQGDHGTTGAVLLLKYTLDGKEQSCKQLVQDIDKEKKQIQYKCIEGDLLKLYKIMDITVHVETKEGVDFITWTLDYELLCPGNPHPLSLLNFYIELTKEIEDHIFGLILVASDKEDEETDKVNGEELHPDTKFKDESLVDILLRIESEFNAAKLAAHHSATELEALKEELRKSVMTQKENASMQIDIFSEELTGVSSALTSLNSCFTRSISGESEHRQEAFRQVHQRLDHQSSRIGGLEDSIVLLKEQVQSVVENLQQLGSMKSKCDDRKGEKGSEERRKSGDKTVLTCKKKSPPLVGSPIRGISRSFIGC